MVISDGAGADAELVAAVAGRPGWRLDDDGAAATYQPPGAADTDGWWVRLRPVARPVRRERYTVVLVAGGVARRSVPVGGAGEGAIVAEQLRPT